MKRFQSNSDSKLNVRNNANYKIWTRLQTIQYNTKNYEKTVKIRNLGILNASEEPEYNKVRLLSDWCTAFLSSHKIQFSWYLLEIYEYIYWYSPSKRKGISFIPPYINRSID